MTIHPYIFWIDDKHSCPHRLVISSDGEPVVQQRVQNALDEQIWRDVTIQSVEIEVFRKVLRAVSVDYMNRAQAQKDQKQDERNSDANRFTARDRAVEATQAPEGDAEAGDS